jgi:hypothetical protein
VIYEPVRHHCVGVKERTKHQQYVDDGVAVEGRHQVAVVRDPPDRLGALVIAGDDPRGDELLACPAEGGAIREIGGAGDRPVVPADIGGQRLDGGQNLIEGHGPVGPE